MLIRSLAACVAVVLACGAARADDARDRLDAFLKEIKGADAGRVTELKDGAETFPDHVVFGFAFPQFPVARESPAPFKAANLIAVPKKKDGKPVVMTLPVEFEKFFGESARRVVTAGEAEAAAKAWARAAAEFRQDGFYRFTVKGEAAKVVDGELVSAATASPDPSNGDKGEVKATIGFKDGKLASTSTKQNLMAGLRPRCQATKLLDPDPIVRGMAEDAIRFMGRSAKPYLDEQRAKASAELREAIDRAWRRIVEEGR
jgi:hypothetical protein